MSSESESNVVVYPTWEDKDWNVLYKDEHQLVDVGENGVVEIHPNPLLQQTHGAINLIGAVVKHPNVVPYELMFNNRRLYRTVPEFKEELTVLKTWLNPTEISKVEKDIYDSFYSDCLTRAINDTGIDSSFLHVMIASPNTSITLQDGRTITYAQMINHMVLRLGQIVLEPQFKQITKARAENAKNQFESIKKLVKCLFKHHARLNVCRLDFALKPAFVEGQTLDEMKDYLSHLLNNRRSNSLFKNMIGYIWKLEHGVKKGLHFHCVFIFDGSKVQADGYYASRIGEYWRDRITEGKGTFYNCNLNKGLYRKVGIGAIDYHDHEKIGYLLDALMYLCKTSQFLMLKVPDHIHCFGRSVCPCNKKIRHRHKLGKKRQKQSSALIQM